MQKSEAFTCYICNGKGSAHEQLLYEIADEEPLLQLHAVESAAIHTKKLLSIPGSNSKLHLNRHRWDMVTLCPPGLLVEAQGEGHTHKEDTRQHNRGDTLAIRQGKDSRLVNAATRLGWSVLAVYPGDRPGRKQRWAAGLRTALEHVDTLQNPRLFTC